MVSKLRNIENKNLGCMIKYLILYIVIIFKILYKRYFIFILFLLFFLLYSAINILLILYTHIKQKNYSQLKLNEL